MGSSAMISEPVTNPIVPAIVSLDSPVASEVGEEDFVGLEGPGTSIFEGAQLPGPTIRELVGDLDKSWVIPKTRYYNYVMQAISAPIVSVSFSG